MCWNNPAPKPSASSAGVNPPGCVSGPCPCTNVELKATIIEVKGLYKPGVDDRAVKPPGTTKNSSYVTGYTSADDKGRIFTNRALDGTWKKDEQFIELTVQLEVAPTACPLPVGTKVKWTVEDPDDPTNDAGNVHPAAGRLIDPNDYSGSAKTGANANDNNPRGKATATPKFEQADPAYALTGDETVVDGALRSKVRFHVSDVAGDNYRIVAKGLHPSVTVSASAKTGIMTVWHRIEIEYVKMASASELPVDQIASHYDIACVQVDVSEKRVVSGASDKASMDTSDGLAYAACDNFASSASGEFKHEKQGGWFFMAAANRFVPGSAAAILFEGNAQAHGDRVRLPIGVSLAAAPKVVRVFNKAKVGGMAAPKPNDFDLHVKFSVDVKVGQDLVIVKHDFHKVDDPDNSFLEADLSHYGFVPGETIPVQVLSAGEDALVVAGISPGGVDVGGKHFFGGKLLVFTKTQKGPMINTLCHELCHAFDNAHKCGNWDWEQKGSRTSCCMNYWFQFVLDDSSPRKAMQWTQNRQSANMCGEHVVSIRDFHLEDNPGLGW